MRKAQAAGDVWTQPMLAVAQHVQPSKLKLIDRGIVRFEVLTRQSVPRAIGTVVAIPHEL